ncbi:MAG: hypothetical protein IKS09_02280 [Lachnospiraceae bacterium]|nr:hypothetical protein [Lachnospiraceae bacterium]
MTALIWTFFIALVTGLGTYVAKKLVSPRPYNKVKLEREHITETWKKTTSDGTSYEYIRETVKDTAHLPNGNMIPHVIQEQQRQKLAK